MLISQIFNQEAWGSNNFSPCVYDIRVMRSNVAAEALGRDFGTLIIIMQGFDARIAFVLIFLTNLLN